jgi:hypothetical protein
MSDPRTSRRIDDEADAAYWAERLQSLTSAAGPRIASQPNRDLADDAIEATSEEAVSDGGFVPRASAESVAAILEPRLLALIEQAERRLERKLETELNRVLSDLDANRRASLRYHSTSS